MSDQLEVVDNRKFTSDGELKEEAVDTIIRPSVIQANRSYDDPKPRFDYILVARKETETTYNGTTFYIPESARQKPNVGVVIAVSDFYIVGDTKFPTTDIVNPGDIVTFGHFQAEDIVRDGKEFSLVSVFDIKLVEKVCFVVGE